MKFMAQKGPRQSPDPGAPDALCAPQPVRISKRLQTLSNVRISKGGRRGLHLPIYISWHFNNSTPSLQHFIPTVSKTERRSERQKDGAVPPTWTHFHVQALIPHSAAKATLKTLWDKYSSHLTSPDPGLCACVCFGTFFLGAQRVFRLTCSIHRSSVHRVRTAASPGESASRPGPGTVEGGTAERCLPRKIRVGAMMFLGGNELLDYKGRAPIRVHYSHFSSKTEKRRFQV